jgi:DNA-binding response OmpR family regulator
VKILIAEDDPVSRRVLEAALAKDGHQIHSVDDGARAWEALRLPDAPRLAILDWIMPGLDGTEICRRLRAAPSSGPIYIILLTGRGLKEDLLAGLEAGADDYVTKPFDHDELRARVRVGARVVDLQSALAGRVTELEEALARVRQLRGLLPICAYCKKVRDDRNYWQQVEHYVTEHTDARFSHSICPDCYDTIVKPELEESTRPGGRRPSG